MQGADAAVVIPEAVAVGEADSSVRVALAVRVTDAVRVALAVRVIDAVRVALAVRVTDAVRVTLAVRDTVAVRTAVLAGVVTTPLQVLGDHNPRWAARASVCTARNGDWYR